jgi:D-lactate dehydrogenase
MSHAGSRVSNALLKSSNTLTDDFLTALVSIAGREHVLHAPEDCWNYGYDNSRQHMPPDAVVFASDAEQIQAIIRLCNESNIPLVTRGRGTGTAGACVPLKKGLVLSTERMNSVLGVDPANRVMEVEPGVTNAEVQQQAAAHGLFWPPDPTSASVCTVGGNLACNAAGPRAVKYGTTRENVLGLEAVTGSGELIHTGVYTTKGVVGYDLTRLLIGSEGTLGVITRAILKLTPLPELKNTLQVFYRDIRSAAQAVADIMKQPVTPCALEFIDGNAIRLVREHSDLAIPGNTGAMLMIEVDGRSDTIEQDAAHILEAATNEGLLEHSIAHNETENRELWAVRKALSPTLRDIAPKKINEDVVVPVSRIPELIGGLDALSKEYGITIVNFGHAGNGNIHVNLLIDPDDPAQMENSHECLMKVFQLVIDLNGTLSGEHGIGYVKRDYTALEIDPVTLQLMKNIKAQFDPNNILNPGKLFPENTDS